jgi:hypothetical protein
MPTMTNWAASLERDGLWEYGIEHPQNSLAATGEAVSDGVDKGASQIIGGGQFRPAAQRATNDRVKKHAVVQKPC